MQKYKAIPNGYMTVGQLAKRIGITVRALQYYDKESILIPSAESEGGADFTRTRI
uniref:MerR family DNA-binding transcriptional regulator n=1 Tax=Agathobacter sp. TaxID=2021311 RepID=UPI004056299A